jgi:hypothetical protein
MRKECYSRFIFLQAVLQQRSVVILHIESLHADCHVRGVPVDIVVHFLVQDHHLTFESDVIMVARSRNCPPSCVRLSSPSIAELDGFPMGKIDFGW